ncbi:MAG: hypothetical protein A3F94_02345 [Candidatus Spechtbacteria bacterium RIFCSPLOWO2_12_FULL_38_22]|uniref:Beta-glucosidase n=1 Tax=Candidatus Spechtbacteria bacterium RIFCSPLOWO2_12_FULL_38_22 TaxID=1802165 RepID=A0A1G2HHU9_9BACT|nr:MAG: hypothetical protein A3A00_00425 [Candidatus Spechtbacteria bacterium RIFCSPLOWO2_01_FULL_38_20]OGZ59905.1 MAG: hypothetical protein A3E58_00590 [Candidatus Spechtbacteria bacterium RIFCSPHIGHO2_12_FULL_38_30]OGZ62047.1 MAG: hypothetical protein A3F94_02345 [Candidatus Spechtbacteria bacterium RIFCSPLOWO2_12_FULL_38_22]
MNLKFPENFFWGCATSAHQVEGNNKNNDWWRAEQIGEVPYKSEEACDSYNRYQEDFDLAKKMHNNAHRFSIEWSRIEPREGNFNQNEIEHYRKVIHALKERGMEPFVTLHHFTNPIWFADIGGWANKKAPFYFARYAEYVVKNLGEEVKYWITINEPNVYVGMLALGYGPWTHWPDQSRKNFFRFMRLAKNMTKAHKKAYKKIKKLQPNSFVGLNHGNVFVGRANNNLVTYFVWFLVNWFKNKLFLNKVARYLDFVGFSYYTRVIITPSFSNPETWVRWEHKDDRPVADGGWEIYPQGIYFVTKQAMRYKKPIFIFENGIADADDDQRSMFIKNHLRWLHKAISEGADVRGYFYWSLLDNFEWAEGFKQKFGLVEVNFNTFERKARPSSIFYAQICKDNELKI